MIKLGGKEQVPFLYDPWKHTASDILTSTFVPDLFCPYGTVR